MRHHALGFALLATVAAPATAAQYLLAFNGVETRSAVPRIYDVRLRITTAGTPNALGGYDITAVSGLAAGETVTGIAPNPNSPGTATLNGLRFDNIFFKANPVFDIWGLGFITTGGTWNIWSPGPDRYSLVDNTGAALLGSDGVMSVTAVPEPAGWMMLVAGFGLVGIVARRRATAVAA